MKLFSRKIDLLILWTCLLCFAPVLYRAFGDAVTKRVFGLQPFPLLRYYIMADRVFLIGFLCGALFVGAGWIRFLTGRVSGRCRTMAAGPRYGAAVTGRPLRMRSRVILAVAIVVVAASFFLVKHRHLLSRMTQYKKVSSPLYKERLFPGLTPEQAMMLGFAHTEEKHPQGSYIEYPVEKKDGTVRIGVFGCSYVAGYDVAQGHEIPSFLQGLFRKAGIGNVEVINFGLSGRGVSHMYLLWEFLGRKYDLDYTVFFLFPFHTGREMTFSSSAWQTFGPADARYIVEEGKLRLIPAAGASRVDAAKVYHRIFPPWRYIRYDRHLPAFLKMILPAALHDRDNPFYYKPGVSAEDEVHEIYTLLMEKVARDSRNVIIISNGGHSDRLQDDIESPNVTVVQSQAGKCFTSALYFTGGAKGKGHSSALGNYIRAKELFDFLTGKKRPELNAIRLSSYNGDARNASGVNARPLYEYGDAAAYIGEYPLAHLVRFRGRTNRSRLARTAMQEDGDTSLLFFSGKGPSLECTTLPFMPDDGEDLYLSITVGDATGRTPVGAIKAPAGAVGVLAEAAHRKKDLLEQSGLGSAAIAGKTIFVRAAGMLRNVRIAGGGRTLKESTVSCATRFCNLIGAYLIGKTSFVGRDPMFEWKQSRDLYLATREGHYVDVDTLAMKRGSLDIVLSGGQGDPARCPVYSYAIERVPTRPFESSLVSGDRFKPGG